MAYKIDFDKLNQNLEAYPDSIGGRVFSLVSPDGIKLYNKDGTDFELEGVLQGGCFDPFDNLYLTSGFYESGRKKNDGINAFHLSRKREDSFVNKLIETRAYYKWEERISDGNVSGKTALDDWIEAKDEITFALDEGKIIVPADSAKAYQKKQNGKFTSPLSFSVNYGYSGYPTPEECEGITFWDTPGYLNGSLHALRLENNNYHLTPYKDTYSMGNFNVTEIETERPSECIYNPNNLDVVYNPIMKEWQIVAYSTLTYPDGTKRDNCPTYLMSCTTKDNAYNLKDVLKSFQQVYVVGKNNHYKDDWDLRYHFLLRPIENISGTNIRINRKHFSSYDDIELISDTSGPARWKIIYKDKDSNSSFHFFTYNSRDGDLISGLAKKAKKKNLCIASTSQKNEEFYWFE